MIVPAEFDNSVTIGNYVSLKATFLPQFFCKKIIEHEISNPFPQSDESFIRQATACIEHDASNLVEAIKQPTIIITGECDALYTPECINELAGKIKDVTIEIIPNAAHMIQLEQSKYFCKVLTKSLIKSSLPKENKKTPAILISKL